MSERERLPALHASASSRAAAMLRGLWERGEDSDVYVTAGAGGHVYALHRLILSQSSPVLACMLSSSFKERSLSTSASPVVIGSTPPGALNAVLAFMYAVPLPDTHDIVLLCGVWELAHRLEVPTLEHLARDRVRALVPHTLSPVTLFTVLAVVRGLRDAHAVVSEVHATLARDLRATAACPLFGELALEDVEGVLHAPGGGGGGDGTLAARFEACMAWCEYDAAERARLLDRLCLQLDLTGASVQEVEAMAARPIANRSSVLMCKIVAGPVRREAARREAAECRVEALEESQRFTQQNEALLHARITALEAEIAALRGLTDEVDEGDRPSLLGGRQVTGVERRGCGSGGESVYVDGGTELEEVIGRTGPYTDESGDRSPAHFRRGYNNSGDYQDWVSFQYDYRDRWGSFYGDGGDNWDNFQSAGTASYWDRNSRQPYQRFQLSSFDDTGRGLDPTGRMPLSYAYSAVYDSPVRGGLFSQRPYSSSPAFLTHTPADSQPFFW